MQKANELKSLGVKESANYPIPEPQTLLNEDDEENKKRLLFVCLGNICRSPAARE